MVNFRLKRVHFKSNYPIVINEVNIKQILISNKTLYDKKGFKYFIGYKNGGNIRPLCIMIPKTSGYLKCFHKIKYICLL